MTLADTRSSHLHLSLKIKLSLSFPSSTGIVAANLAVEQQVIVQRMNGGHFLGRRLFGFGASGGSRSDGPADDRVDQLIEQVSNDGRRPLFSGLSRRFRLGGRKDELLAERVDEKAHRLLHELLVWHLQPK